VVYLLVTTAVSLFVAGFAGLIQDRSRAALVGFVVAYAIFSAPWYAGRAGLFGPGESDDEPLGWLVLVLLVTILAAPVGLLGGLIALVGSVLKYPPRRSPN
jgi:hypothetical protein